MKNRWICAGKNLLICGGIVATTLQLMTCGNRAIAATQIPLTAKTANTLSRRAMAALGKKMFFDASLSASGRMSCASCHSPEHAYGPPNHLPVQFGGADLKQSGKRAVPTLMYALNRTPRWFREQAAKPQEQNSEAHPPFGGFTWDGRVDALRDQAAIPWLDPNEMANPTPAAVVAKIARAAYAGEFRRIFGENIFAETKLAFAQAAQAIEYFELDDASFHPYTSKYDAYLDGKAQLSAREMRGLKLFNDPNSGNCAFCHSSRLGADGSHPLFTNFQFEALGVPRNPALAANADPAYYDMGLCGPLRRDKSQANYCGLFKTPTLRNVAQRGVFFHNGYFHTLKDALRFYVQRDTHPYKWYPRKRNGEVDKFNDLPEEYRGNIDTIDVPLNRKIGDKPVWDDNQIADVVAFLKTLTDGYTAPSQKMPIN